MNLQLALILLGVATFIAIVAFSIWQSRYVETPLLSRLLEWIQRTVARYPVTEVISRLRPQGLTRRVGQKEPSLVASAQLDLSGEAHGDQDSAERADGPDAGQGGRGAGASTQSLHAEIGGQPLKIDYWARLPQRSIWTGSPTAATTAQGRPTRIRRTPISARWGMRATCVRGLTISLT